MRESSSIFQFPKRENQGECRVCGDGRHGPGQCERCNCGEDELVFATRTRRNLQNMTRAITMSEAQYQFDTL